jgi:hypothetical protein
VHPQFGKEISLKAVADERRYEGRYKTDCNEGKWAELAEGRVKYWAPVLAVLNPEDLLPGSLHLFD